MEDAAERLVVAVAHAIARRGCDVNISHQLDVLAVVVVASVDLSGEKIPFISIADGVRVKFCTAAVERRI